MNLRIQIRGCSANRRWVKWGRMSPLFLFKPDAMPIGNVPDICHEGRIAAC